MKKYIIVIISISIVLLSILFLKACATEQDGVHNGDWSYKQLPNNYVIWHINSSEIVCGKMTSKHSGTNIVDDYVLKFCYDTKYVCLQCVDIPTDLSDEIDKSNPKYYIIDTTNDAIQGPLSEQEYLDIVSKNDTMRLSSWIETDPQPKGAVFT